MVVKGSEMVNDVAKSQKPKVKQNLSDEERQRRRERMIELRQKLANVKQQNAKQVIERKKEKLKTKKVKEQPKLEKVEEESDSEATNSSSSESEYDEPPTPPAKKGKQVKPTQKPKNVKQSKGMVKKVVKIKYYGDVSNEQVEADSRLLQGIHQLDTEALRKKKDKTKQLKENDTNKEAKTEEQPKDPKQEKLDKQMRELFG